MKRFFLCLVLILGVLIFPRRAFACSCIGYPTEKLHVLSNLENEAYGAVFVGTVSDKKYFPGVVHRTADPVHVTFDVSTTYKGKLPERFTVVTAVNEMSCGYSGFKKHSEYLVFAYTNLKGQWDTGLCSGNVQMPSSEILSLLEAGYPPSKNPLLRVTNLARAFPLVSIVSVVGLELVSVGYRRGKQRRATAL